MWWKRKGGKEWEKNSGKGKEKGPPPYFVQGHLSSKLSHWAQEACTKKLAQ